MIVSSSYTKDEPQIDGRFWVHEVHTLDDGSIRRMDYLADNNADTQEILNEHISDINAELVSS